MVQFNIWFEKAKSGYSKVQKVSVLRINLRLHTSDIIETKCPKRSRDYHYKFAVELKLSGVEGSRTIAGEVDFPFPDVLNESSSSIEEQRFVALFYG